MWVSFEFEVVNMWKLLINILLALGTGCVLIFYVKHLDNCHISKIDYNHYKSILKNIEIVFSFYKQIKQYSRKMSSNENIVLSIGKYMKTNHTRIKLVNDRIYLLYLNMNNVTSNFQVCITNLIDNTEWLLTDYHKFNHNDSARMAHYIELDKNFCDKFNQFRQLKKELNELNQYNTNCRLFERFIKKIKSIRKRAN